MKQDLKKNLPSALLLILLAVLILCPLIMVFAKAIVNDGRLDLYQAWENIANPDNLETIRNSMLLGVCVVLCSTVIAVPTAQAAVEEQQVDTIILAASLKQIFFADKGKIPAQFEYRVAHSLDKCSAEVILMESIRKVKKFHHILIEERILL